MNMQYFGFGYYYFVYTGQARSGTCTHTDETFTVMNIYDETSDVAFELRTWKYIR